jgi:hypothetical protein
VLAGLVIVTALAGPAAAQALNAQAEVRAALDAIEKTNANLPGMGGLGAIPDPDLKTIQGMLGEADRLVREARRRLVPNAPPDEVGWIVGYARAGKAFAEAADEFRVSRGYR